MSESNNMANGVVYRSATSGLWYENIKAAGDIDAVRVEGVTYVNKADYEARVIEAVDSLKAPDGSVHFIDGYKTALIDVDEAIKGVR